MVIKKELKNQLELIISDVGNSLLTNLNSIKLKYSLLSFSAGYIISKIGVNLEDLFNQDRISISNHNMTSFVSASFAGILGYLYGNHVKKRNEYVELIEGIANVTDEALLLISKDEKTIIWGNKASEVQYGVTLEEMIGKKCYEVTHNDEKSCIERGELCPIAFYDENNKSVEHIHTDHKCNLSFLEVSCRSIKNENNQIISYVHMTRDITSRKKEETLQEIEKHKKDEIINNPLLGLFVSRRDGSYVNVNKTYANIFGFDSPEEMIENVNAKNLYSSVEERYKFVGELIDLKSVYNKRLNLIDKNGKSIHLLCTAQIDDHDVITGAIRKIDSPIQNTIPICSYCNTIRDESISGLSNWIKPADYFQIHGAKIKDPTINTEFSHGICPPCYNNVMTELEDFRKDKK